MNQDLDRRIAPRVSISLPIQLETDDGAVHSGTIENLSESGMLIIAETDESLAENVRILFGAYESDRAIELRGRIVRSSPLGQYGVAFVEIGDAAREVVRRAMMRES